MLTNAAAKAAAPQARAYKMADAGGLFLFIAPTGTKSWRLKYRWHGREKLLTIGRFPELAVAEARARREEAKAALRGGRDPAGVDIKVNTLEQLGRAWYLHNRDTWSFGHASDVLASLERDIFPVLGNRPVVDIDPPALLNALRVVEKRGRAETARRIRQRLSQIFAYGIAEGLATIDPAAKLGAAMRDAPPSRPQPALTVIEDCRALLSLTDQLVVNNKMIVLASRFLALTAVRLDAVRGARWEEFHDLDGAEPVWRVPPERMKLKKAKKGEARFEHLVPLSCQSVRILRKIAAEDGCDTHSSAGLVFPGRDRARPIGEGAIGALYARAGFAGRHVPHGWRSSFSTILNETMGEEWRGAIDRALAHSPKDKVEAAYNRSAQLGRRRELFDAWGALLSACETKEPKC